MSALLVTAFSRRIARHNITIGAQSSIMTQSAKSKLVKQSDWLEVDPIHRKERVLGPWYFPSLRASMYNPTSLTWSLSPVSLNSPCLYSIGAAGSYLAMADSSSSIALVEFDENRKILWVSFHSRDIH